MMSKDFPKKGEIIKAIELHARNVSSTLSEDRIRYRDPWSMPYCFAFSEEHSSQSAKSLPKREVELKAISLLPEQLFSMIDCKNTRCFTGILLPLNRAWLSSGNKLFFWNFQTGSDFLVFDNFDQDIFDVILIAPRHDIFVSEITNLLAVVMPSTVVILCTISPNATALDDLVINHTGLTFSTDDARIVSLAGTADGRIFCGGSDGNIYEMIYQAEEGWFSRRCRTINRTSSWLWKISPRFISFRESKVAVTSLAIDNSRFRLYALYDDDTLRVFSFGEESFGFHCIATNRYVLKETERLLPPGRIDTEHFKLSFISSISREESATMDLMAVSNCGMRLFFATSYQSTSPNREVNLTLVHIRLPAIEKKDRKERFFAGSICKNGVKFSLMASGVTVMASELDEHLDVFDLYYLRPQFGFSQDRVNDDSLQLSFKGRVWDLKELPSNAPELYDTKFYSRGFEDYISATPTNSKKYFVLSNVGLYMIQLHNPIYTLKKAFLHGNTLRELLDNFGVGQAIFFVIHSALGDLKAGLQPVNARCFFEKFFHELYGSTALLRGFENTGDESDKEISSRLMDRHNTIEGFYLFYARLMSKFWNESFIQLLNFSGESFQEASRGLISLNSVIETCVEILTGMSGLLAGEIQKKVSQFWQSSLASFKLLVARSQEFISFLSICQNYKLIIQDSLGTTEKYQFSDFENLISTSSGFSAVNYICRSLVKARSVRLRETESLASLLLQRCPQFFNEADVQLSEGHEVLSRALNSEEPMLKQKLLVKSLKIFTSSALLTMAEIFEIASLYRQAQFWTGIIDLLLFYSSVFDPDNINLLVFKNPEAFVSAQQQEMVTMKRTLFSLIFEVLSNNIFDTESVQGKELGEKEAEVINHAIKSSDESFHYMLYSWLCSKEYFEILLKIETPYIEEFLEGSFVQKCNVDLRWKYYADRGLNLQAARLLEELTSRSDLEFDLDKRIEYLSLALGYAKGNAMTVSHMSEYINTLKERLEVAQLQREVMEGVLQKYGQVAEVQELNSRLFDMSELFNKFAVPLNLPEQALSIMHSSSYNDPSLTHCFWREIIEKECGSSEGRFESFAEKISTLSRKLYPSQFCFPLDFILDSILRILQRQKNPVEKAVRILSFMNVPKALISSQLRQLHDLQNFWKTNDGKDFLAALQKSVEASNWK